MSIAEETIRTLECSGEGCGVTRSLRHGEWPPSGWRGDWTSHASAHYCPSCAKRRDGERIDVHVLLEDVPRDFAAQRLEDLLRYMRRDTTRTIEQFVPGYSAFFTHGYDKHQSPIRPVTPYSDSRNGETSNG